jgi:tape measure domain-containing protein
MNTDNGSLEFDFYLNNTRLQSTALEAERRIKGLSDTAVNEGKKMESSFGGVGTALAAIGGTAFLGMLGSKIISVTGEFQQLDVAFTTMLGSKEKADRLMAQIVETAAKTPFTLTEVAQGAKQLLAYQVAAEDVNDTVIRLGNIASGVSVPLSRLILVYGQVKAKGKLMGDDLRQFTEAGLPIISELAKSMGVADSEISKMVENGKVGFPEVQKVIQNLTNEGGMFFNLMEKQSATITGQISNLKDAFDRMLNSVGQSNSGIISSGISGLSSLVSNYETVGKVLIGLVATYGSYKAAVIVTNALSTLQSEIAYQQILANIGNTGTTITLTTAEGVAAVAKSRLTAAQLALNGSILANPYALAIAALVGLAIVVYNVASAQTEAQKAQQNYIDAMSESNKKIDEEKSKVSSLLLVINDESNSREYRNQKLRELIAISPEHLNNLTLENLKTSDGKAAIDAYVISLEKKIKMQTLESELTESIKRSQSAEGGAENLDWIDKAKVIVANQLGGPASGAIKAAEYNSKNNKAVIDAEKNLQKKIKEEINNVTGGNKDAGKKTADVIINAKYWEEQVKSAKESLDALNTNSKTYSSDRKKELGKIAQGEAELEKIRGKKGAKSTIVKDTNNYEKDKLDAQKKALSDEQSVLRKGIEEKIRLLDDDLKQSGLSFEKEQELLKQRTASKKDLIDFDLTQTLKAITDEETAFKDKAKKSGIKNPDLSSFTSMRTSATTTATNNKAAVTNEDARISKENLEKMLVEYQSFEEKRKVINEKYAKERQQLLEGKKVPGADVSKIDSSISVLDQYNAEDNANLDTQIAEKEIAFKGFIDKISMMGLEELQNTLESANNAMQNSGASDTEKAILRAKIKELQKKLGDVSTNGGKDSKEVVLSNLGIEKSQKTVQVLKMVNDEIGNAINNFSGLDDATKQALSSAQNIAGSALSAIAGILTLSLTSSVAITTTSTVAAEAVKSVERASVILAIIGAAIAIVSQIVSLFDSAKKKREQREIDVYAGAIENLKAKYEDLGRAIDKALGGNKFKLQKDGIENLKKQQADYAQLVKLENDRKKTDAGKVKEYQNAIKDNTNEIEDTITKMREDILGMDVSSAANDLGGAIIDAFAAGEDAAAAWGNKVNDIVGDVIRKMLLQKLVEEPVGNIINKYMAQWVDSEGNFLGFDTVMSSAQQMGTELSAIGPGLSSALEALPDDIKKYITGDTAGANENKTALSGSVKSVSEETAGAISGQLNAMRINQMESINVLRQQLLSLNQIAINTDNLNGILTAMNTLVNGGRAHGLW